MMNMEENSENFQKEYETLNLKKNYFLQNLQEELAQFTEKNKNTIEIFIEEFITIYRRTIDSEKSILQK